MNSDMGTTFINFIIQIITLNINNNKEYPALHHSWLLKTFEYEVGLNRRETKEFRKTSPHTQNTLKHGHSFQSRTINRSRFWQTCTTRRT